MISELRTAPRFLQMCWKDALSLVSLDSGSLELVQRHIVSFNPKISSKSKVLQSPSLATTEQLIYFFQSAMESCFKRHGIDFNLKAFSFIPESKVAKKRSKLSLPESEVKKGSEFQLALALCKLIPDLCLVLTIHLRRGVSLQSEQVELAQWFDENCIHESLLFLTFLFFTKSTEVKENLLETQIEVLEICEKLLIQIRCLGLYQPSNIVLEDKSSKPIPFKELFDNLASSILELLSKHSFDDQIIKHLWSLLSALVSIDPKVVTSRSIEFFTILFSEVNESRLLLFPSIFLKALVGIADFQSFINGLSNLHNDVSLENLHKPCFKIAIREATVNVPSAQIPDLLECWIDITSKTLEKEDLFTVSAFTQFLQALRESQKKLSLLDANLLHALFDLSTKVITVIDKHLSKNGATNHSRDLLSSCAVFSVEVSLLMCLVDSQLARQTTFGPSPDASRKREREMSPLDRAKTLIGEASRLLLKAGGNQTELEAEGWARVAVEAMRLNNLAQLEDSMQGPVSTCALLELVEKMFKKKEILQLEKVILNHWTVIYDAMCCVGKGAAPASVPLKKEKKQKNSYQDSEVGHLLKQWRYRLVYGECLKEVEGQDKEKVIKIFETFAMTISPKFRRCALQELFDYLKNFDNNLSHIGALHFGLKTEKESSSQLIQIASVSPGSPSIPRRSEFRSLLIATSKALEERLSNLRCPSLFSVIGLEWIAKTSLPILDSSIHYAQHASTEFDSQWSSLLRKGNTSLSLVSFEKFSKHFSAAIFSSDVNLLAVLDGLCALSRDRTFLFRISRPLFKKLTHKGASSLFIKLSRLVLDKAISELKATSFETVSGPSLVEWMVGYVRSCQLAINLHESVRLTMSLECADIEDALRAWSSFTFVAELLVLSSVGLQKLSQMFRSPINGIESARILICAELTAAIALHCALCAVTLRKDVTGDNSAVAKALEQFCSKIMFLIHAVCWQAANCLKLCPLPELALPFARQLARLWTQLFSQDNLSGPRLYRQSASWIVRDVFRLHLLEGQRAAEPAQLRALLMELRQQYTQETGQQSGQQLGVSVTWAEVTRALEYGLLSLFECLEDETKRSIYTELFTNSQRQQLQSFYDNVVMRHQFAHTLSAAKKVKV